MGLLTRIFKAITCEILRGDTDSLVKDVPYTVADVPVTRPPVNKDVPQENQILTRAETKFFNALTNIIDRQLYAINLKTRLKDVNLTTINDSKDYSLLAMHIDFLLINMKILSPILAIELDDSSHNGPKATAKDIKKNDFLRLNKIPLLRIKCSNGYDSKELRNQIYTTTGIRMMYYKQ